ncbi:28S ribosomal protein S30, mitochondrial [Cephus cinctus]|uniref:28S ribosomal protein S30, mitochondrial n=1 Tax=Cephus cinctus TaxID=211228 RepID=A0AAJ7FP61_CEPCN|nr:28S ribosomal protein S30, mitochondrial [Cephus cinctus]
MTRMSLVRIKTRFCRGFDSSVGHIVRNYSVPASSEKHEKKAPQYPPIQDQFFKERRRRTYEKWHEDIKSIKTVEEKLFKINVPRYYGWKSLMMHEYQIPYNSLDQAQYITRTHLVKDMKLPSYYETLLGSDQLDHIVQEIRSQVEDAIAFEYIDRKREGILSENEFENRFLIDSTMAEAVVRQVNRILLANLSSKYSHLLETQVDYNSRLEAFWVVGGIDPTYQVQKCKENVPYLKKYANDPVDRHIQYKGKPIAQLRYDFPLHEFISLSESENPALTVPQYTLDPRTLGYSHEWQHGTSIPGFWPGDKSEFGGLSYHNCSYLTIRPKEYNDEIDALSTQSLLASYAWLLSQACYQGFSTFNDLTYPLVTQTIITNGQTWSFSAYQLNTTVVHSDHVNNNPRRNVCWITKPLKLFEKVENGKLVGFNEDVLRYIVSFYANAPQERVGINMKPYLGETENVVADIEDPERRAWLEKHYKHLVSNRPRHRLRPEIYAWQKIYMIDNKRRPMEKRREPWQFNINMGRRRLDDHTPEYIPKALRPGGPKSRKKWANTYYP